MQNLLLAAVLVILSLLGTTHIQAHGNRWTTPDTQRGRRPAGTDTKSTPAIPVYRESALSGRLKEIRPLYSLLMGYYSMDVVMAGQSNGGTRGWSEQIEGLSDYIPNVKL